MIKKNKIIFKYWLWPFVYILLIFSLSSLKLSPVKNISFFYLDKILHFIEYAILAFILMRAFDATVTLKYKKIFLIVFIICVIIGGLDEYYQSFILYRQASFLDFLADVSGILASLIMFRKIKL